MAKKKFDYFQSLNYQTDNEGRARLYSDEQRKQFQLEDEARQKIERANQLKLEIQTETNNLLAQYAKEKQGFERKAMIGKAAQFVVDPRMWAKGVWEVGKMVTENPRDVFIGAPRGAMQSKEATKLYEQSAALNTEATRIAQTDKTKSQELLKQSQELYKTAQEKYGKAVGNLGELTTGKQIAAKSALAGLDIGSFLPGVGAVKGGIVATQATSKLATKIPAAVQTTKLTGRANLLSNALGIGDIYQGTQVAIKQGLGEATEQTLKGQVARAALQGPVYGTLGVLADEEQDDTLGNIVKSSFITGASASALTLGFGWVGRALVSKVSSAIPSKAPTTDLPTSPTQAGDIRKAELERMQGIKANFLAKTAEPAQAIPTQDPIKQSLGAFDPETTIPMLDLTKTVKGNNIDFNPDSALSVNSARKVVDDLALLNGKQVGGKSLQIDKNDPKYQEIYNTQIKPLIDRINAVDEVAPVEVDEITKSIQQAKAEGKTFDDWLKNYSLYHGTPTNIKSGKLQFNVGEGIKKGGQSGGLFLSDNPNVSRVFGENIYQASSNIKKEVLDLTKVKNINKFKKEINKTYLDMDGEKIVFTEDDFNLMFPNGKADFASISQYPELVEKIVKKENLRGIAFDEYAGGEIGKTYQILEGEVPIKTKSELKSQWNAVAKTAPINEVSAQQIVEVQSQLDNLKTTEQEVGIELGQNEMQLEVLLDELKTHPGKTLHKYANKREGKLPEITGKGSKYARQGDSIMTELGFTSDDEAQDAYQSWLNLIRQRDSLKANIKESSTFLKDITKEQQTLQKQLEGTQPPIESYDQPQFNKIPTEEVELEVSKIYNTLENEGFKIVPEKVIDTPAIDALDEKLAKGDQPTAEEMDASMKELVDTTGDPEVIAGVQQELNDRKKESTYYKRVVSANPELDNKAIVQYDVANMAEAQKYANDLVANDFDKAKEIAENINPSKIVDPRQVKVTETYTAKLLELGRYDEASDITANLSRALTKEGQSIASVRSSNIADPVAVIRKLNNERQTRFSKELTVEVAKVKEQLNNVVIDKDAIIEILDNITCR
jgi:hypothetical protein